MKAISQKLRAPALRCGLSLMAICAAYGQTLINLGTQGRNVDFSNAPSTRPEKTGTALPATCNPGELFFNTAAPAGQNLYGCSAANTWGLLGGASGLGDPGSHGVVERTGPDTTVAVPAPSGTIVGTTDTQILTNKTIDASEIKTGMFAAAQMPAFTGDVSTPSGSTVTTLATVNSSPGTYGDSSHSVQLSVDAKGRVTAITQLAISGGGGGGSSSITAGPLANMPNTCTTGTLYFATDQPAGQQIYTCSSPNVYTQVVSLGPSGALAYTNGSLDIVTAVVPRLTAANTFTGLNIFSNGIELGSSSPQPTCSTSTRGLFWFQNNGSSKDTVQVCVFNGTSYV